MVPCLQAGLLGLWRCSWYWLKLQEAGEWARGRSAGRQEQSRGSLSLSELKLIYTHRALKSLGKQQAEEPFWVGEGALREFWVASQQTYAGLEKWRQTRGLGSRSSEPWLPILWTPAMGVLGLEGLSRAHHSLSISDKCRVELQDGNRLVFSELQEP